MGTGWLEIIKMTEQWCFHWSPCNSNQNNKPLTRTSEYPVLEWGNYCVLPTTSQESNNNNNKLGVEPAPFPSRIPDKWSVLLSPIFNVNWQGHSSPLAPPLWRRTRHLPAPSAANGSCQSPFFSFHGNSTDTCYVASSMKAIFYKMAERKLDQPEADRL